MLQPDYKHSKEQPRTIPPTRIICVPMGAYAIVDVTREYDSKPRLLNSGGYLECVGVLACVKDANSKPIRWGLSHVSVHDDGAQTVQKMVEDLRQGDDTLPMTLDVIGGQPFETKPIQTGTQLMERTLQAVQAVPNATVRDFTNDHDYRLDITVDLKTGQKYAAKGIPFIPASELTDSIIHAHSMHRKKGYLAAFAEQRKTAVEKVELQPALKFDWEKAMPEIAEIWDLHEKDLKRRKRDEVPDLPLWSSYRPNRQKE